MDGNEIRLKYVRTPPTSRNQTNWHVLSVAVSQFRVCVLSRTRPLWSLKAESFRETSLTSSAVVKCDGRAFAASPGYITRCFTLTSRESGDLRHAMSPFSLFLSFFLSSFSGSQRILGKKEHLWAALWCNWPSNAPQKDADPELRRSKCVRLIDHLWCTCPLVYWVKIFRH